MWPVHEMHWGVLQPQDTTRTSEIEHAWHGNRAGSEDLTAGPISSELRRLESSLAWCIVTENGT